MDGIGWAAGAMSAARARLDVAAENLANGSTDGYRKSTLRGFIDASGVHVRRSRDRMQGALRRTGRPFDFAITGPGAFRMRGADGRVVSTRNGAFVRDRFGRLCDDSQRVLLGERGAIIVPAGATVRADGAIVRNGEIVDRIPLAAGSSVQSGFLEASNVDAIGEMIDVLAAQRSFETAQKVLTAIDKTRESANTQVGSLR
jgi:flagellar basal body rod protein FlgG